MGSLTRRLRMLEDRDRERAAADLRRAWERLSDEEVSRILAPFHFGREPTTDEATAAESFREVVPEALIARAIGYSEHMADEEVSRRLREALAPVPQLRRDRLLRQLGPREKAG
ncbi:MAG: hypothetical protein M3R38_13540 [Actinomycetota bacterium]|nr:hypothetical protein [Actinomycetota bacterium]